MLDIYQIHQARGFYVHVEKSCLMSPNFQKKLSAHLGKLGLSNIMQSAFFLSKIASNDLNLEGREKLLGNVNTISGRNLKDFKRVSFNVEDVLNLGFLESGGIKNKSVNNNITGIVPKNNSKKRKIF